MGSIYDALTKAEAESMRQERRPQPAAAESPPSAEPEGVESGLVRLNLGRHQIDCLTLAEAKDCLLAVDEAITDPEDWLKRHGIANPREPQATFRGLRELMLRRKRRVLDRIDHLITDSRIQKLRQLAGSIGDRRMRAALNRELNELQAKDHLIKTEARLLDDALERLATVQG